MQSKTSLNIFRFIAWFAAVYHLALGFVTTFGTGAYVSSLAEKIYGVTITIDPDLFMVIARFTGSYLIAFGLMMLVLALKPYEYRRLAWVGVIFIAVRLFDRIAFFEVLNKTLGVTFTSSIPTFLVLGLMALGFIFFMPRKQS